jgi:hypothetical protein
MTRDLGGLPVFINMAPERRPFAQMRKRIHEPHS